MKKFIIIFLMSTTITFLANAKPPHLSVEQLFDGRYNNEKTVSTFVSKDNGSYYRMLQVSNNPAIVKITNNGETIDIGFQQAPSGKSATLFIKGPEKAFK